MRKRTFTLIRQPNGLMALFSYKKRCFTHLHLTPALFDRLVIAYGFSAPLAAELLRECRQAPDSDWFDAIRDLGNAYGDDEAYQTHAICSRRATAGGILL